MKPKRFVSAVIPAVLASLLVAACMPYYAPQAPPDSHAQSWGSAPGGRPFWNGMPSPWFGSHPPGHELSVDEVRDGVRRWIAGSGNTRLKAGKIAERDAATISAEIVTLDDSLVQKIDVDRRSGRISQTDGDARAEWRPWGPPSAAWWRGANAQGDWGGWMSCPFCGTH